MSKIKSRTGWDWDFRLLHLPAAMSATFFVWWSYAENPFILGGAVFATLTFFIALVDYTIKRLRGRTSL